MLLTLLILVVLCGGAWWFWPHQKPLPLPAPQRMTCVMERADGTVESTRTMAAGLVPPNELHRPHGTFRRVFVHTGTNESGHHLYRERP